MYREKRHAFVFKFSKMVIWRGHLKFQYFNSNGLGTVGILHRSLTQSTRARGSVPFD